MGRLKRTPVPALPIVGMVAVWLLAVITLPGESGQAAVAAGQIGRAHV